MHKFRNRNPEREQHLLHEWQYFKPLGPYMGENAMLENLNEMSESDVERLIEIGDEMAEYIDSL